MSEKFCYIMFSCYGALEINVLLLRKLKNFCVIIGWSEASWISVLCMKSSHAMPTAQDAVLALNVEFFSVCNVFTM